MAMKADHGFEVGETVTNVIGGTMLMNSLPANTGLRRPIDRNLRQSPPAGMPMLTRRSALGGVFDGGSCAFRERPVGTRIEATVEITSSDSVKRRSATWEGMAAEIVQVTRHDTVEFRFRGTRHLLVVHEQGVRRDGETFVEGLPKSTLRDVRRKLTFVPAGHEYVERHDPRVLACSVFFYLDPDKIPSHPEGDRADALPPRLLFEDATLWNTALKLKRLVEGSASDSRPYFEALGVVLAHELVRLNTGEPRVEGPIRGGLAPWQQRLAAAYIEEHLAEHIPLATLAQLVRLSPYYFCRAFKQSFGLPPHRYHNNRRIEHAKILLAEPQPSVTDIGLTVGFSETSSFTTAFRRTTGLTPTAYHRSLT
jgi:AraC family transcriptional regulator